jgi:glycosyltransferase involved in cell wall biosynthesis
MVKILHVIPSVSALHGGPSQAIVTIEKSLSARGAAVTTLTTDDDGPGRRLAAVDKPPNVNGATRIYARKWTEFYKIAPSIVIWLWGNVRLFDLVHIHGLFSFSGVAAGAIAFVRRVPYVVRPYGTLMAYGVEQRRPRLKRLSLLFFEGPILRNATFVHFTSTAELDEARRIGIPFKAVVIPLGVEVAPLAETDLSDASERPKSDAKTVLYLSRIDPKKNIEGLLRAFAVVRETYPDAVLLIAGSGSLNYVLALKKLAAELAIEENLQWLGHVEGTRKLGAFLAAQIFTLPSFSENFGVAAVEAMLLGLPCILGEGVAIAKEVSEAGAGLVVAPHPPTIAAAIVRLLDDDDYRRRMGERAKSYAEREYSTAKMTQRLMALYESVISSDAGSAT